MSVNVGQAVGYLDLDTSKFTSGFQSAAKDLKVFQDQTATFSDKLTGLGTAMQSAGSTLTKNVTVPLAGAGAAMVATSAKFESAMSEVAAISGATGEDLDALTAKAKEMGATTKFSASESAEALKYMAMAGWDTQKMLDGLPGIMNLAAASGENLGTVSDIVTDAMTAFGLSADQAAHFSDVLAQASNKSNTNVAMLGESFKYVAPVAGALGFSIEDTAVALGLMANSGIKASQAGTSLRSLFTNLTRPVGQAAVAIEDLNISMTNSDGTVKSLSTLMAELRVKFADLTDAEKAQYAAMLAGQEGMSGLLAIVNTSEADFNALSSAINNADGAAQTMSDTMLNNLSGQLTILKSTIEGIAISFGDIMLPVVKQVVQKLQDFATWLNNLSEAQKETIVKVATFVAALGPLLLIGGKLLTGISSIISVVKAIPAALTAMKAGFAAVGASVSSILLPIAAVVAAIIAFKIAWDNNMGNIQERVQNMWVALQDAFNQIIATLQWFGDFFMGLWESDWMGVQEIFNYWLDQITLIFTSALDILTNVFEFFKNVFSGNWSGAWENIVNIFNIIINRTIEQFKNTLNIIIDTLIRVGVYLYYAAQEAFNNIATAVSEIWSNFKEWWSNAVKDPVTTIKNIGQDLYNAGQEIFNKLWDGLRSIWNGIADWVSSCVDWIVSKVQFWKDESAKVSQGDGGGSHAAGLDYVPYDGYRAILHEGEAVLTKQQNKEGKANTSGGDTFNFYSPENIDAITAAREFKRVKQELAEGIL